MAPGINVTVVERNPQRLRYLLEKAGEGGLGTVVIITSAQLRADIAAARDPLGELGVPGSRLKELLDTPVVSTAEARRVLFGENVPLGTPDITHVVRAHCHITGRTGTGQWAMDAVSSAGFPGITVASPADEASAYLDIVLDNFNALQA